MISGTDSPLASTEAAARDAAAVLEAFIDSQPTATLEMARTLIGSASSAPPAFAERLDDAIEDHRRLDLEVDRIAVDASLAQAAFDKWTDERVDRLLRDLATRFDGAAEDLAAATVNETGFGNLPDKTLKNRFASIGIYNSLAGEAVQGALRIDAERKVTELASAVGVVFGIVPVTNPVATAMFKTLIALKARNALILSFHHGARGVGRLTADIIRRVLEAHGAPRHLVQVLDQRSSRRTTRTLMSHPKVSLILATGGAGLVKAAYSSVLRRLASAPGMRPPGSAPTPISMMPHRRSSRAKRSTMV